MQVAEAQFDTAEELGKRMKVSPRTILKWAKQGKIPSMRPGPKIIRFNPQAVAQALSPLMSEEPSKEST